MSPIHWSLTRSDRLPVARSRRRGTALRARCLPVAAILGLLTLLGPTAHGQPAPLAPLAQSAPATQKSTADKAAGQAPAAGRAETEAGSPGGARPSGQAIAELLRFSRDTRSATGEFTQQALRPGDGAPGVGNTRRPSLGTFAFARPGRFRWNVTSPFPQLIVTDGRQLQVYDEDLQQLTIRPAEDSVGATPAAVLFGTGDLEQAFRLSDLGEREGRLWVEAKPRDESGGFDSIRIGLRDGLPEQMIVRDAFGQSVQFSFSRIVRNASVADSLFTFTPPAGTDVLK